MVKTDGKNALKNMNSCFICNCTELDSRTKKYRRCRDCGHETLLSANAQSFIVNDFLSEKEVHHMTSLDHFKSATLTLFDSGLDRKILLDVGSASGKFLYHNATRYLRSIGIEITIDSLNFSRDVLGLDVVNDIHKIPDGISIATAWHSLEHIPEQQLLVILDELAAKITPGGRFIISVPNGASFQSRWFGQDYAFFDVPTHLHQFTPESLRRLMQRFGFNYLKSVNSKPYNVFGYIQSLLNIATRTHNYFYYRLKRRSIKPSVSLDIANGLLLLIFVPIGWLLGMVDKANLKYQGVITVCFEKKLDHSIPIIQDGQALSTI